MKKESGKTEKGGAASTSVAVATSGNTYYSMLTGTLSNGAAKVSGTFYNTFYWFWSKLPLSSTIPGVPHSPGNPLGKIGWNTGEDGLLKALDDVGNLAIEKGIASCYLANKFSLVVVNPEWINQIKTTYDNCFSRQIFIFEALEAHNILTFSNKKVWSDVRKLYSSGVQKSEHINKMQEIANKHLGFLADGREIDLHDFFVGYVLDVVTQTLMGLQDKDNNEETLKAMKGFFNTLIGEFFNFGALFRWKLPEVLRKLIYWKKKNNNLETFNREVKEEFSKIFKIDEILKDPENKSLLKLVAEMLDNLTVEENPEKLGSKKAEGISQGLFILTAAATSTIAALEAAFQLLEANPTIKDRLYRELFDGLSSKEIEDITLADINKVEYLDWFIKEVLRLYPPVPLIPPRDVIKEFEIGGIKIPIGSNIFIAPWVMHYFKKHWGENANEFDPERFKAFDQAKFRGVYGPFGGGARMCIGIPFADADMKLIFVKLLMSYQFKATKTPPSNPNNKYKFDLTMEYGGLSMKESHIYKVTSIQSQKQEKSKEKSGKQPEESSSDAQGFTP